MPCPPVVIATGFFIDATSIAWSIAPNQSAGNRSVTRTSSGITATGPTGSVFHPTVGSYTSKYMFFGSDNYLVILDIEGGGGSSTRHVGLVDFTTTPPSEHHILTVLASSNAIPPPNVQHSQGNGAAFLVFAPNGSEITNCAIYRSSDGLSLCVGPPPFVATGETQGEATASQLKIHYSSGGTSHVITCPKPQGSCQVTPAVRNFPDAVIGGPPALATTTGQFTIRNNGSDCLTISTIGDVAPFSAAPASPLPKNLEPNQTLTVTVTFAPSAVGTYDRTLPITRSPAVGDAGLVCHGVARTPIRSIAFIPANLSFGIVPLGSSPSMTSQIRNTGEVPLNVSWGASPGGPFSWAAWSGTLAPGAQQPLTVTFAPSAEGGVSGSVTINHDATTGGTAVTLSGTGCVPNAVITPPPIMPISLGDVQRGFRMVRFIVVRNTGDAPLTFQATISGPDADLYRLVDPAGSITGGDPTRSYAINPLTGCGPGPTGPGEVIVAVVFFADRTPPATATAQLVLDGHNGSNTTPTSYTYQLSANVVPGIPVDGIAVLDRSGSMSESAGTRTKSEVEVSAGRLFAQLIREDVDDRLGLVRFNEVASPLHAITPVTSGNHASIVDTISPSNVAPTGATCIAGGMIVAFREFTTTPRPTVPPQLTKAVVVLTDGMDNTGYLNPDDGQWYSLLGGLVTRPDNPFTMVDTIPVTVPSGIRVYGIGLGTTENIDHGRLDAVAGASGGYFGIVGTDLVGAAFFNLEKYFTQIYMNMVGTSPLLDPVMTIGQGDEHRIEFTVLRGDVGALVVVYDKNNMRLPFHLESPTGELIEASHVPPGFQLRSGWTDTARFIEFLLPLGEPDRYAGRWAVVVRHPGEVCIGDPLVAKKRRTDDRQVPWGFLPEKCRRYREPVDYGIAIGVGSNLRMQPYVTPSIVHVGDPLTLVAVLTEAGLPVLDAHVTVHVESPSGTTWNLDLRDDGANNDGTGDDGEYARLFVHTYEAGSYQLTFHAEAKSRDDEIVTREATLAKYVEGRIPIGPRPDDCKYEEPTEEEEKRWLEEQRKRENDASKSKKRLPKRPDGSVRTRKPTKSSARKHG